MAETAGILAWTLVSECPVPDDVNDLLVDGETALAAYRTFRDAAIFTDRRLIVRDVSINRFTAVSCEKCGFTELYRDATGTGSKRFDFLVS